MQPPGGFNLVERVHSNGGGSHFQAEDAGYHFEDECNNGLDASQVQKDVALNLL